MYLISTTQRCGSTWVTRLIQRLEQERLVEHGDPDPDRIRAFYINGTELGFRLLQPSQPSAVKRLTAQIKNRMILCSGERFGAFKTHDIAAKDFDLVTAAIPGLRMVTVHRDFKDVVVSRYFYYRYYWPTEPGLGKLSPIIAEGMATVSALPDRLALRELVAARLVREWAKEWAAFELPFSTTLAIRLTYEELLDGSAWPSLERFAGRRLPAFEPFAVEQIAETETSGRTGKARFNREGTAGQWMNWFNPPQAARLDAIAERARLKQLEKLREQTSRQTPAHAEPCT
jgi:hypothetical protein